ncbi:CU044_2847 family protein [Streptomyces xantholiticus]|uniref:CU044_2847 family protein n=1 Tax=Streptomyces xantholiticus TaxID=68285 RepID=UPI0016723F6C|nr:CU044_2847 family protein [Streptomyces xantholiticus]GGW65176.1 hypothetical protein GCM10010381_57670 [Streptomyces xantholiticus]
MTGQDGTAPTESDGDDLTPDDGRLLVEFPPGRGIRQVAVGPADLLRRSEDAVNAAMGTIRSMAQRVNAAVGTLPRRPDEVEVEFGITLDAESGAMIAKAGVGAALTVRLTWSADSP